MAIVKVAKGGRSLKQAIDYINKENDFLGKDLPDNAEDALEQMLLTKEFYEKEDGRQYKHYILSFKPDEATKEIAKAIAEEFAEENFKGFEVAIGTHTETKHIHCHIVVNSVNWETGKKFDAPKSFLDKLKDSNDRICKSYDLEIPKRGPEKELDSGEVRIYNMDKYQVFKKVFEGKAKSYVVDAAVVVKKSAALSESKSEFIKNMRTQGYTVNWVNTRKHVTFTDKDGKKVRLANLEKTFSDIFYSKEALELEFKRNLEQRKLKPERFTNDIRKAEHVHSEYAGVLEADQRIKQADEILHSGSYGQGNNREHDHNRRIDQDRADQREGSSEYDIDVEFLSGQLEELRKHNVSEYTHNRKRTKREPKTNDKGVELDKGIGKSEYIKTNESDEKRSFEYER